jgi:hypothetical protein
MKQLFTLAFLLIVLVGKTQVKIGNNPATIDANSLLEMEATDKGFLPPRVTLTSLTSASPLTGTVPAGMLVYNSAGSLAYGFYYWDGTEWKKIGNGLKDVVTKTANATLTKSESVVLASNDITITLPVVTSADNGLEIVVKNTGTYTDLITVAGNGGATIDGFANTTLTKNVGKIFIATAGNWVIKNNSNSQDNHTFYKQLDHIAGSN